MSGHRSGHLKEKHSERHCRSWKGRLKANNSLRWIGGKLKNRSKNSLTVVIRTEQTESASSKAVPSVHFGGVGAGKHLAKNESTKRELRAKFNVLAVDCGFQAVMESLEGNRREDFALVRVACDWQDGLESRNLQSDAALRVATFTKLLISLLPRPRADSDHEE